MREMESEAMSDLKMHYAMSDVQIGVSRVAIFAFRCVTCSADFHIDHRPNFCPQCGVIIDHEERFREVVRP